MRKRIILFAAFAILICGILLFFSGGNQFKPNGEDKSLISSQNSNTLNTVTTTNMVAPTQISPASPAINREQKMELAPNSKNVAINFYGRVIDQDGHPLSGVRVAVSTRRWLYASASGLDAKFIKTVLETDSDGRFQLDENGDDLAVETIEKSGYEPEPKALRGFGYSTTNKTNQNPNNPVVFRMWKSESKQQLLAGNQFLPIVPDGRTYTFDLIKGNLLEGEAEGDLRFWLKRSDDAKWGGKYDWSFEITPVGGGLKEEADAYDSMFLAPDDGYIKKAQLHFHPSDEQWTYGVKKRFYLKARNGQIYGRIEIEIDAYYLKDKQGRFGINYSVNPSGSRILR